MSVKEGNVISIPVEDIEPHPNNPRKNVGDVSELADSIKQSGLLQNLTVVPHPEKFGKYRGLIGHRRLAAAKQAGLEYVPCIILEGLSLAEQIAIMVAENMQRQDLTIPEQVESIQLMIDLGMSVEKISEKTGLGKSTVYKRRAFSAFESSEFKKSAERGGTLQDYMKVAALKDEKARQKVLKAVGTNNFNMELNTAKNEEKKQGRCKLIERKLNKWATKVDSVQDMRVSVIRWVGFNYDITENDEKFMKPGRDCEYVYTKGYSDYEIYEVRNESNEPPQKTPEQLARAKKEQERAERYKKLKELSDRMETLRFDFIESFSPTQAEKKIFEIADGLFRISGGEYMDLTSVKANAKKIYCEGFEDCSYKETVAVNLLHFLFAMGEKRASDCYDWNGRYKGNIQLTAHYENLRQLGYEISDEEQAYLNGTHELYLKED